MERLTRPLFRFDPGWLFIAGGVAICAAGVILPAQNDLRALQSQLEQLHSEEVQAYARLKAHADFMDQVDRADPALIRRLAATQLNVVPAGDTPVLLAASASPPVTHWIESAVQVDLRPPKTAPTSILSRLANGPYRLWMFGAGIMSVFIGLLLAPISWRVNRRPMPAECRAVKAESALPSSVCEAYTEAEMSSAGVEIDQNDLLKDDISAADVVVTGAAAASLESAIPQNDDDVAEGTPAPALCEDVLTEAKLDSVVKGIESDLLDMDFHPMVDSQISEGGISADQREAAGDEPVEPPTPEIATDASHFFESKNRMAAGDHADEN